MTADAGWYPDGAGQTRFWDGARWTGYTSIPAFDAVGRSDPAALAPPAEGLAPSFAEPPSVDGVRRATPGALAFAGLLVGLFSLPLPFLAGLVGGLLGLALSIAGSAAPGRARLLAVSGIVVNGVAIVLIL